MSLTKNWISFLALIPIVSLIFLDQTILPVALPTIQLELHATSTALQWSINAYFLAIALFVLVSGKIGDRIGHRNALLYGMGGFSFFSLICAASPNIETLIIARGFQGTSAALMIPSQTAMVAQIFPKDQRGQVMGIVTGISSIFLILGPFVGGLLTETLSWRSIFWVNLPISAFGLWMIYTFLPNSPPQVRKIDSLGFFYFASCVGTLTILFMQAASWGWLSIPSLICIAIIPTSFFLLLRREKWAANPFLDISLFKNPLYVASALSIAITNVVLMITVFRSIYLQDILEYSAIQTGLIICISAAPICLVAPIAGRLSDRFGSKLPVTIGFISLLFSFLWFGFFSTPALPSLMIALFTFGMGIPMIFTPSFSSAITAIPLEQSGSGSGMIFTLRMIANTLGLAFIHLFITTVQNHFTASKGKHLAEIISFSTIHFALGALLIIAYVAIFLIKQGLQKQQ